MKSLKEWAGTINALQDGAQTILLRKGGILDTASGFRIESDKFLLFPTFEHQQLTYVKPEYKKYLNIVQGDKIKINSYATVVSDADVDFNNIRIFADYHIWSDDFIKMRSRWKPEKPFKVLLLRVYLIPPCFIDSLDEYKGCRSWIDVKIDVESGTPVISDDHFNRIYNIFTNLTQ